MKMGNNEELMEEAQISYEEILSRAQVEREQDSSIIQTAKALFSASYLEGGRDVILEAREKLLKEDPRELYLKYIKFLVEKIKTSEKSKKYFWIEQLDTLAIRGLGIKIDDLEFIGKGSKEVFRAEPKCVVPTHILDTSYNAQ